MSYLFLYEYSDGSKWAPWLNEAYFNTSLLAEICPSYKYDYVSYAHQSDHYLHKIANVALDYELQRCSILEIEDDFKAIELRLQHEQFLTSDYIKLYDVYENPNFDVILDGCPLVKGYADRGATKREDSKYVTKVASSVDDVARAVQKLNGALGEDFEKQFSELAYLCSSRIASYKDENKKNTAALTKERKLIRKRLEAFRAKAL